MKRSELIFNIVSIFVDGMCIILGATLSYLFRYRTEPLFPQYPIQFALSYSEFLQNAFYAVPILLMIFGLYGLYSVKSTQKIWHILPRIAAAVSTGLMLFVAVYFFNPQIFPSRLIVLMSWILIFLFVGAGRVGLLLIQRAALRRGIGLHKLVLLVNQQSDFNLHKVISGHPEYGYRVIEVLYHNHDFIQKLDGLRMSDGIDEIIQADPTLSREENEHLLKFTHDYGIRFNYVPDIIEAQRSNVTVSSLAGIPLIELNNTPLEGWGKVVKRIIDLVFSLFALIILSPLLVLVALGVKIDSKGRVLFVQERFGQGRSFKFYKFRSMYQELSVGSDYGGRKAEEVRRGLWKHNVRHGPFLKIKNDPRVTRFGRLIRRTKLDELPQFFNVLKGDMSLVGPRAHVLDEVDLYRAHYKRQFTIKPGITGITQITQARIPDLPFEEEIRLDTFYLENWSVALDIQILFRTLIVLLRRPPRKEYY